MPRALGWTRVARWIGRWALVGVWWAVWAWALLPAAWAQVRELPEPSAAQLELSEASALWLAEHPVLRVGVAGDWAPVDVLDRDGGYTGISGTVLDRVARMLRLTVEVVRYPDFAKALAAAQRGDIDVLPSMARSVERDREWVFTQPYLNLHVSLIARRGASDINRHSRLADRRIAIERGFVLESLLKREYPQARLVPVDSTAAALQAVADGSADVYVGVLEVARHVIETAGLTGLQWVDDLDVDSGALHFALPRHHVALRDALDVALQALGRDVMASIALAWQPRLLALDESGRALTDEERTRYQALGEVRVGLDGQFAPISEGVADRASGYAIDLFHLIADKLGLRYRYFASPQFSVALEALKRREIDVLVAAMRTAERLPYADFVGPYYVAPSVIVSRMEGGWNSLAALSGRRLAIDRSHYLIPAIRRETPAVQLVEVDSVPGAFDAVLNDEADALVTHLEVATRLINQRYLGRLQISGVVEGRPSELYFAVRNDQPELVAALRRGLDGITSVERAELAARWLRVSYSPGVPWGRIAAFGIPLVLLLLGIIALFWRYNQRLRAEVAARRAAELALGKERDAAAAQAAAKADFLAAMGHEVRTPLAAISGGIDLLHNQRLEVQQQRLVDRMRRACRYLVDLLNDILDYAKLDAHRIAVQCAPAYASRVVREVVEEFEPLAQQRGLYLICETPPPPDIPVMLDARRVRQVVANLVVNAIKFTERGGVHVAVREVKRDDGRITLTLLVSDTGMGMDVAARAALFQRFSQVHEHAPSIGGSGLGLAIVRELVELMGGTVHVESTPGQGSTFSVIWTVDPSDQVPEAIPAPALVADSARGRALVIEDDATVQFVLSEQMQALGYEVSAVETGQQALALLAQEPFDVVISDLSLPGMSGLDLARAVRELRLGAPPLLVAFTGDASDTTAQACITAGFARRLIKPVSLQELQQALT